MWVRLQRVHKLQRDAEVTTEKHLTEGPGSSEFMHLCSCVTARGTQSCSVPRVSDPSTNSEDPNHSRR
jgi:hypothetical protein